MLKDSKIQLTGAVVLATAMAVSARVDAKTQMLVLIDASGSMATTTAGGDRFESAKTASITAINNALMGDADVDVAVYTFHDTDALIPATHAHGGAGGFIPSSDALDEIEALTTAVDVGGGTPLAGAMCGAAQAESLAVGTASTLAGEPLSSQAFKTLSVSHVLGAD